MLLTVVPMRRNSPRTGRPSISRTIFCERSPRATAVMTRATSLVGATRSAMSWLQAAMPVAHEPFAGPTDARSCILPSCPTTLPTRTSSPHMCSLRPMTSFISSPARLRMPSLSVSNRTLKSPCLTALRISMNCSTSERLRLESRSHSVSLSGAGGWEGVFRALRAEREPVVAPWPFAFVVMVPSLRRFGAKCRILASTSTTRLSSCSFRLKTRMERARRSVHFATGQF